MEKGEKERGEKDGDGVDIEISSAAEAKWRCTSPKVILGQKFATKVAAAAAGKPFDFRFAVYSGCKDKIFLLSTSYFLPATG